MYMESGNISDDDEASLLAAGSTPALLNKQECINMITHIVPYSGY